MATVIRSLVLVVLGLALAVGGFSVVARFADGPLGPFPGGALEDGEWADAPDDWSAVLDSGTTVALQVNSASPRSVTTTSLLSERRLYIPSLSAARKRWPQQALDDPLVVLRHADRRYRLRAVRVSDPQELAPLVQSFDPEGKDEGTWYFRLDTRTEDSAS